MKLKLGFSSFFLRRWWLSSKGNIYSGEDIFSVRMGEISNLRVVLSTIYSQYFWICFRIFSQHFHNILTIFVVCQWVRFPPWWRSFPLLSEVVTSQLQTGFGKLCWLKASKMWIDWNLKICLLVMCSGPQVEVKT